MIDFPLIIIIATAGITACAVILETFRAGYEKEKRGERKDFLNRPNNHIDEE